MILLTVRTTFQFQRKLGVNMLTYTQSSSSVPHLHLYTHTFHLQYGPVYKHEEFICMIIKSDEISDNRILFHVTAIRSGSAPTSLGYRCTYFFNYNEFHRGILPHSRRTKQSVTLDRWSIRRRISSSWSCELDKDMREKEPVH